MKRSQSVIAGSAAFALGTLASLSIGSSSADPTLVFQLDPIVTSIRLPRSILAAIVGASLAISGAIFQGILRNPLADPYIIGVSGGAALGGVLAMICGIGTIWLTPLAAFAGACTCGIGLLTLAYRYRRSDPLTILLLGIVFNTFAAALVTFLKTTVEATKAQEILFWLMGIISAQPWETLGVLSIAFLAGLTIALMLANRLNLLTLGDSHAQSMGLNVTQARTLAFVAASLLVGAAVSVAGMVGFVGLIVPHIVRRLVGADFRIVLPLCGLGGATFLMLADTVTRLTFLLIGTEIPVGVITAFAGAPFFGGLLLSGKSS